MDKKISRRSFLRGSIAALAASSAAGIALPSSVKSAETGELATLIDIRKCIGCGACVEACREVNADACPEPQKPFPKMYPSRVKAADWSEKRDVDDRLTPYNWLYIQSAEVDINGESVTLTLPRRCMHCQNPPCADLCPWGAARKLKNGITLIHPDICLGGKKCQTVCPWEIPQRQTGVGLYLDLLPSLAGNGVMYKCHRCYSRIEQGNRPACIEGCPEGVQTIGPREEIVLKAHEIVKEINGFIYGETENGGTNTLYVSPVPFEQLNKAVEKGAGNPHLEPVKNSMAHTDNIAKAMVFAPMAGAIGATLKLFSNTHSSIGKKYSADIEHQEK